MGRRMTSCRDSQANDVDRALHSWPDRDGCQWVPASRARLFDHKELLDLRLIPERDQVSSTLLRSGE